MPSKTPYQAILGMVIGLSILSYLLKQPIIAYTILAVGFISLLSETLASKFAGLVHGLASLVFGTVLKIILALVYFLLITPIALLKRRTKSKDGWQENSPKPAAQMKYTW